jgi:hypothetical protein
MLAIFVLGFFLDFVEISIIILPLTVPILLLMGLDPIWLAVLIAINLQTSFLTPPFGFSLFYLRGAAPPEIKTLDIYKGVDPLHRPAAHRHRRDLALPRHRHDPAGALVLIPGATLRRSRREQP